MRLVPRIRDPSPPAGLPADSAGVGPRADAPAARGGADLGRVHTPRLLIYSRRDPTVPVSNARRVLDAVGSTEREVHYLARSHPVITVDLEREEVTSRVRSFIGSLDARYRVDGPR